MPEGLGRVIHDDDGKLARAIADALSGDAAPLARVIEAHLGLWELDAGALLAIAPRLHAHREQLADAIRNARQELRYYPDELPFDLVEEVAMRRDLAALTGDTAAAGRWQHVIDAQMALLDDPEKVIALLLWDQP